MESDTHLADTSHLNRYWRKCWLGTQASGELKSLLALEDSFCMCMHIFKIYKMYCMPPILIIWKRCKEEMKTGYNYKSSSMDIYGLAAKCLVWGQHHILLVMGLGNTFSFFMPCALIYCWNKTSHKGLYEASAWPSIRIQ